jgi:hypothetical protein
VNIGLVRVRILLRLFGLVIGFVSTGYFALAFWLMMHGMAVRFVEPNPLVIPFELSIAATALIVLFATLVSEIVKYE